MTTVTADRPPKLRVRLLHGFLHRFVWDGGPVHVDGTVREGDRLAGFGVVDLPGHAPGPRHTASQGLPSRVDLQTTAQSAGRPSFMTFHA